MSFFYDLNKKLDGIRATPEVTHQQLNERDEGKPGKNFAKIAKDAGERYGSKVAGERVAGAVRNKLKAQGKLEEGDMDESAFQAAIGKKKYGDEGMKALQKAGRDHASAKTMSNIRNKYDKYDESVMADEGNAFSKAVVDAKKDGIQPGEKIQVGGKQYPVKEAGAMSAIKKVGQKVASGVNKLVGHGSDEEMIKDLQRRSGAPVTGKKPTFADKIANAKKEVDEMLGDVAAEAIKTALSPKQKKIDINKNGKLDANDFAMLRKGAKKGHSGEMDEERSKGTAFDMSTPRASTPKVGSVERGHKHDIKHTATGRVVTRRTDDQGNSVGADDESDAQAAPRGRGRPKGTKGAIGAKGPSGKSKLITKESDVSTGHLQQMYNQLIVLKSHVQDPDGQASLKELISMVKHYMNQGGEQELDEKAVSKKQQKFMGMVHATQKGEKAPSKEVAKVAKTMKKKDAEDFASTKHKGLPEKAPKKKKEEEVEESSTTSGSVATSTATGSKGGVYGKGIYDSMNFELEQMIAESMSVNMSDSTEGGKSLTITATDEDALKLGMLLKNAGLGGGDARGGDMHSHGEEPCETCGMQDCGCGDVQEAVDENAPDWPTNTETSDNAMQYAGGLNKPKSSGMATIPVTDVQVDGEDMFSKPVREDDALRRMMEMAGIRQDELDPSKETMKEEAEEELDEAKECSTCHKDPCMCEEDVEEGFLESIQRMRAIAGIQEAKKPDFLDMDKDGDKKEPMSKAVKDKEEKKVEESIFALTNQWKAYRG